MTSSSVQSDCGTNASLERCGARASWLVARLNPESDVATIFGFCVDSRSARGRLRIAALSGVARRELVSTSLSNLGRVDFSSDFCCGGKGRVRIFRPGPSFCETRSSPWSELESLVPVKYFCWHCNGYGCYDAMAIRLKPNSRNTCISKTRVKRSNTCGFSTLRPGIKNTNNYFQVFCLLSNGREP